MPRNEKFPCNKSTGVSYSMQQSLSKLHDCSNVNRLALCFLKPYRKLVESFKCGQFSEYIYKVNFTS